MKTLILNQSEVSELLPMRECIALMERALRALAQERAVQPLRTKMWLPEKFGLLGLMPGYLDEPKALGIKVITIFPHNKSSEFDSHQGAVLLFDAEHGQLLAMMDASAITAIRTAAVSGLATRLLAREDASDLAILGSGVQAQTHLEAILAVRSIKRVRVWSRNFDNAKKFAERAASRHKVPIETMKTAQDAVAGAEIICTVTASAQPILRGDWLSPGVHINAVGSSLPSARELDTQALVKSKLFVDRRESTLNEAGDFLFPQQEGALDKSHIQGEVGEILLHKIKGRESSQEITLFKSLGLAVEDVAAAHFLLEKARKAQKGTWVEFGSSHSIA
jgi:ornithine cyclodeaminase